MNRRNILSAVIPLTVGAAVAPLTVGAAAQQPDYLDAVFKEKYQAMLENEDFEAKYWEAQTHIDALEEEVAHLKDYRAARV